MCNEFIILSDHGHILIDGHGNINRKKSEYFDDSLKNILFFDMHEFNKEYPYFKHDQIDILDIGYFYFFKGSIKYEPPVEEFRCESRG